MLRERDDGQNLIHSTVNSGEKVLRSTRTDGKEIINEQLSGIQSEWDRLLRKMSTTKVQLETSLLQWADYSSSYNQLRQLLQEREDKLQEVYGRKVRSPGTGWKEEMKSAIELIDIAFFF